MKLIFSTIIVLVFTGLSYANPHNGNEKALSFEDFIKGSQYSTTITAIKNVAYWQYRVAIAIEDNTKETRKLRLVMEKILKQITTKEINNGSN